MGEIKKEGVTGGKKGLYHTQLRKEGGEEWQLFKASTQQRGQQDLLQAEKWLKLAAPAFSVFLLLLFYGLRGLVNGAQKSALSFLLSLLENKGQDGLELVADASSIQGQFFSLAEKIKSTNKDEITKRCTTDESPQLIL